MIREYQPEDVENVIDIWYQATILAHPFLEDDFLKQEEKNTREIYLPNTRTWIYEVNHQPAGFIAMMGNEVGALFVLPQMHNRGIGSQLINQVATMHDELEVEVFEKNQIGRSFYNKYGFEEFKRYWHKDSGFEMIRMKYSR